MLHSKRTAFGFNVFPNGVSLIIFSIHCVYRCVCVWPTCIIQGGLLHLTHNKHVLHTPGKCILYYWLIALSYIFVFIFLIFYFVAKHEIKQTLSLLQEVIVSVSYERKRSKDILYKSIESLMDNIVQLFDVYINEPGNRERERQREGGKGGRGTEEEESCLFYYFYFHRYS